MSATSDDAAGSTIGDAFARLERARGTNAECAAKALAISDELRKLERRKVELTTMRKLNTGQRNVWLDDLTEKTIIPYSKAWNREFAEKMRVTFPLEIRSMIHDYLLDSDMWDDYEYALQAVMAAVPPEIGHCRCLTHGHGLPRVPHYLFADYMGSDTAQEIVGKLYESVWFKGETLFGVVLSLPDLLHKDAFGAGFDPASCIKNLEISCLIDSYREPPTSHAQSEACQHTPSERRYIDREELESSFNDLRSIAGNKDFGHLEVIFMQRNIRVDVLEEALETFSNVYQILKEGGIEMRIQWQYSSPTCGGVHEHSRNLGKFFSEARSTWKQRMVQFLQRMKPCIEPRHVKYTNEPRQSLSDADFVHRMWDSDEAFAPSEDEDEDVEEEDGEEEEGFEVSDSDEDSAHVG